MTQFCRICLKKIQDLNCLVLKEDQRSAEVKIKLSVCTPNLNLALLPNPTLCVCCLSALDTTYMFLEQCRKTEELIRNQVVTNFKRDEKPMYVKNCEVKLLDKNDGFVTRDFVDELNDLLDEALEYSPCLLQNKPETEKILLEKDKTPKSHTSLPNSSNFQVRDCYVKLTQLSKNRLSAVDENNCVNSIEKRKTYTCVICKYPAKNLISIRKHRLLYHSQPQDRPSFKCSRCEFRTVYKTSLATHMKTHNGIFLTCYLCGYKNAARSNLISHIRRQHYIV